LSFVNGGATSCQTYPVFFGLSVFFVRHSLHVWGQCGPDMNVSCLHRVSCDHCSTGEEYNEFTGTTVCLNRIAK